ncbi:MAG TPA: alcohol dehydrogenase catalytic domain-containing protein [Clostridia bacterium]|nr:alcohol dehydrogenase catalytic domain-containing protein [Clostridia bacterium]
MKAAVLKKWKELEIMEVEKPSIKPGECLIKVIYGGVCGSDVHIYNGHHATAKAPMVMCHEIAGEIAEINGEGSNLKVGDKVTVEPLLSCGKCVACRNGNWHVCSNLKLLGIHVDGGFAEYVKVNIDKVVKLDDIPMDIAVLTEPLAVGLHVVRRSELKVGQTALIVGGGPIGLVVALMAKLAGASKVVVSEGNKKRIILAEEFGFDTINAFEENMPEKVKEFTDGDGFDVVYEVTGSKAGVASALAACKIRGTMVHVGFCSGNYEYNHMPIIFKELKVIGCRVYSMQDFIDTVEVEKSIIKNNTFDLKRLISDVMTLEEIPEAVDMMTSGVNLSKIVIKL